MSNEIKFKAIGLMCDRNQDIRLSNTVIECKKVNQGGLLTFGIDHSTQALIMQQMATGKSTHVVVCLVINGDQLQAIEKELIEKDSNNEYL